MFQRHILCVSVLQCIGASGESVLQILLCVAISSASVFQCIGASGESVLQILLAM